MIQEHLNEILLSKRMIRSDPVGDIWINDYYQEVVESFDIKDTEIMVCNTLQRRCSCASVRGIKVIILDNYLSELFIIFNQILECEEDEKYIEPLFCKLIYESYFVEGEIQLAAVYKTLTQRAFNKLGAMQINQVSKHSKPQLLYTQQAFLVMHEVMHSFFKDNPGDLSHQKEIVKSLLDKVLYNGSIKHVPTVTESYLEEMCCDHLAAYSAISLSIEKEQCSEIDAACAVILVLHYQFLLMCIDKTLTSKDLFDGVGEFAVRVTIIRLFVNNYFKVKEPELVDPINNHISETIDKWNKIYQKRLTQFLISHKQNLPKYRNIKLSSEELDELQRAMHRSFKE